MDPDKVDRPRVIGYREWIAIPEWGIRRVRAKADTGARTSAIDAINIHEIGDDRVRFDVVRHRLRRDSVLTREATIVRTARVKSSTGESIERYFVVANVHIGELIKPVEFSLVNRAGMIHRILLGRAALMDDFLVDPSVRYTLGELPPPGGSR